MSAIEEDEVYRWSTDDGINPTLQLIVNADNNIEIQNPTFKPTETGTLEYYCEFHPDTMRGVVEVTSTP